MNEETKSPACPTGRRYTCVSDLMLGEGLDARVIAAYAKLLEQEIERYVNKTIATNDPKIEWGLFLTTCEVSDLYSFLSIIQSRGSMTGPMCPSCRVVMEDGIINHTHDCGLQYWIQRLKLHAHAR